jgi:hypothetical protein
MWRSMMELENLETCRKMYYSMEISTTRRVATSFYSHNRRNSKEFVHKHWDNTGKLQVGKRCNIDFLITFTFEHESHRDRYNTEGGKRQYF